jgi:hypothetical protein
MNERWKPGCDFEVRAQNHIYLPNTLFTALVTPYCKNIFVFRTARLGLACQLQN